MFRAVEAPKRSRLWLSFARLARRKAPPYWRSVTIAKSTRSSNPFNSSISLLSFQKRDSPHESLVSPSIAVANGGFSVRFYCK